MGSLGLVQGSGRQLGDNWTLFGFARRRSATGEEVPL